MPICLLITALAVGGPPPDEQAPAGAAAQSRAAGSAKTKPLKRPQVVHPLQSEPGIWVRTQKRAYGTQKTVRLFRQAVAQVRKAFAKTPDLPVGDLSWRGGGRMRPHRSHRDGRDIDAGYYFKDGRARKWFARARYRTIDVARTWALFSAMIATGEVQYIFVSYRLQKALYRHARKQGVSKKRLHRLMQWPRHWRKKAGIIRFERGHEDHFHVRFHKTNVAAPGAQKRPTQPGARAGKERPCEK